MENISQIYNLSELSIGQTCIVIKLREKDREIKRHLLDMGLTKGTLIYIKKVAPLGNPIDIELRGYNLIICKEILKNVLVKVIEEGI